MRGPLHSAALRRRQLGAAWVRSMRLWSAWAPTSSKTCKQENRRGPKAPPAPAGPHGTRPRSPPSPNSSFPPQSLVDDRSSSLVERRCARAPAAVMRSGHASRPVFQFSKSGLLDPMGPRRGGNSGPKLKPNLTLNGLLFVLGGFEFLTSASHGLATTYAGVGWRVPLRAPKPCACGPLAQA